MGNTVVDAAVIEAHRIAEGVTGNTTAKVTFKHRLIKLGSRHPIIRCRDDLHMATFVSTP